MWKFMEMVGLGLFSGKPAEVAAARVFILAAAIHSAVSHPLPGATVA